LLLSAEIYLPKGKRNPLTFIQNIKPISFIKKPFIEALNYESKYYGDYYRNLSTFKAKEQLAFYFDRKQKIIQQIKILALTDSEKLAIFSNKVLLNIKRTSLLLNRFFKKKTALKSKIKLPVALKDKKSMPRNIRVKLQGLYKSRKQSKYLYFLESINKKAFFKNKINRISQIKKSGSKRKNHASIEKKKHVVFGLASKYKYRPHVQRFLEEELGADKMHLVSTKSNKK